MSSDNKNIQITTADLKCSRSLTRGSGYNDLTGKIMAFWKSSRLIRKSGSLGSMVAHGGWTVMFSAFKENSAKANTV